MHQSAISAHDSSAGAGESGRSLQPLQMRIRQHRLIARQEQLIHTRERHRALERVHQDRQLRRPAHAPQRTIAPMARRLIRPLRPRIALSLARALIDLTLRCPHIAMASTASRTNRRLITIIARMPARTGKARRTANAHQPRRRIHRQSENGQGQQDGSDQSHNQNLRQNQTQIHANPTNHLIGPKIHRINPIPGNKLHAGARL